MTWPDYLVVGSVLFIASGISFVAYCLRVVMGHDPLCSCGDCVDTALAIIERDTQQMCSTKGRNNE